MQQANIRNMYKAVEADQGFDVIIVVSPSKDQAQFWQERLEATRGSVIGGKTRIISLEEDWPGGAGQLLGALYAWNKARFTLDLDALLQSGGTVAMCHLAGKGMRMAPLPAAEANNKSAIKLPRLIETNGRRSMLTILEAVIFQTGIFATSRAGRLCVFWGDQVFIPSKLVDFEGKHHAEIFDMRAEIPEDEDSWERDWQSYGLIVPAVGGDSLQREKQTWQELRNLMEQGVVKPDKSGKIVLGKSLGCFSLSYALLSALLQEFGPELKEKRAKMDTDPHLWMPLTSGRKEFVSSGKSEHLWDRINEFKNRFLSSEQEGPKLFGDKDLGKETLWWDYGQVRLYHHNSLKLLEDSPQGECMRQFYDLEGYWVRSSHSNELTVENSILLDSQVKGSVKNSVLLGVGADELDVSGCTIINSSLCRAQAKDALIYNCVDLANMELSPEEVVADVFLPSQGRVRMRTALWRDGKAEWESVILGNPYSFETLNKLVEDEDLEKFTAERDKWIYYYENREKLWKSLERIKRGFIKPNIDNIVELVWGGNNIEKVKELPMSGKRIGESWECSTHPNHPSLVSLEKGFNIPLNDLINLAGEDILGQQVAREFKGRLPILFKFVDARDDLSVQVHPSDEKARELGERETGKNEAWLILQAEKGAVMYLGFKEDVNKEEFEEALSSTEVNIAEQYLNAIPVKSGDVLFNPTGTPHAIGKGIFLAEVQQSSGITYRVWDWNRVPQRPLHIAKAMESLNFEKSKEADFERIPRKINDDEERLIDSLYFSVDRLSLTSGQELGVETKGGFQILICLQGEAQLIGVHSSESLLQGGALLVPACLDQYRIVARKDSVLLKSFMLTP